MEMTGERRLRAPRDRVWQALNNPEILRASIPGCRSLEPAGDAGFTATAAIKIGPIAANFTGDVRLLDLDPPNAYRIEGAGQGGAAGFAKGGAAVRLTEEGRETLLSYTVKAEVGGKLAQLGARLIDASAKQMADQFFDNFAAVVAAPADHQEATPPPPTQLSPLSAIPREIYGYPLIAWAALAVFLFIAVNLFMPR
jgi:uncharacterized protein